MKPSRRDIAVWGGGLVVASLTTNVATARQVTIEMRGSPRGERVWFNPLGIAVDAGVTLRFLNRDPGNSHTATAYHPDLFGRAARIPTAATPWNSDFLLPGKAFEVALHVPGVYDYYCIPHEMAGMVGRIVVGRPGDPGWEEFRQDDGDVEPDVKAVFPSVDQILRTGQVEARGGA